MGVMEIPNEAILMIGEQQFEIRILRGRVSQLTLQNEKLTEALSEKVPTPESLEGEKADVGG